MNKPQNLTREFMIKNKIPVRNKPTIDIPYEEKLLRIKLLTEETAELIEAIADNNIVKVADAIADILYVTYGSANAFGIDIEPIFDEVHRSNMTKEYDETLTKRVFKGPSYSPPVIDSIIDEQLINNKSSWSYKSQDLPNYYLI